MKGKNYQLITEYKGYINKFDITNVDPGFVVSPSQNVLSTDGVRLQVRKGYVLKGGAQTISANIHSSFEWQTKYSGQRALRAYYDGLNTILQVWYASEWLTLAGVAIPGNSLDFATFWNPTELLRYMLFVDGTDAIYSWSGAVDSIVSTTATTIAVSEVKQFATSGSVSVNGTIYSYTGLNAGTNELTGVTPNPTGEAISSSVADTVGSTNTFITMPPSFNKNLISNLYNQVYVSGEDNIVYVSKINSFTDYSSSSPRIPGDGAELIFDAIPGAMIPSEDTMSISCGTGEWYTTEFTLSFDQSTEALSVRRRETTFGEAAFHKGAVTKAKNHIIFVSQEPALVDFSRLENVDRGENQNLSDPIKLDFDVLNFTNCHVFYFKYNIYIALPNESLVYIYNMSKKYWEAPQTLPVQRLAVVDGVLVGHSNSGNESFELFTGDDDDGSSIDAKAHFSYLHFGPRWMLKKFHELFIEGRITPSTELTVNVRFETGRCGTTYTKTLSGGDELKVCALLTDGSLGKNSLGKASLAGKIGEASSAIPKFRWIPSFTQYNFHEVQFQFESNGAGQRWELIAFGPDVLESNQQAVYLKD